jgi:hypothetical protein
MAVGDKGSELMERTVVSATNVSDMARMDSWEMTRWDTVFQNCDR